MRLDLFLKASRLVPRRTVARHLSEAERIHVNGITAKASKEVNIGDEIQLNRGSREITVRIQELPLNKQVSRAEASTLFEVLSDKWDSNEEITGSTVL